jgi:hypothetical protein
MGGSMPNFTEFVTFKTSSFTVPDPATGNNTKTIDSDILPLRGLDRSRDAVLAFTLISSGTVKLTMKFNSGLEFINRDFNSPDAGSTGPRVLQGIISGNELKRQGNELKITANGSGHVELSDFVLSYHVTTA